jgi:hypothetical protein
MSTTRQKQAARRNLEKARQARSARTRKQPSRSSARLNTAAQNRVPDRDFAFPDQRKEPLTDARHVRNAIARFDQVEGVTDTDRNRAWTRIKRAAKKFDVDISEDDWRELFDGGKARKQ